MADSRKTKKQLIEELDQLRQQVSELKKESANKPDLDPADCRLAKKALGEVELLNSEVISSVGEGIVVYDREFRILVWNPFMERLSGMTADQVLGKIPFDLFPHLREQGVDRFFERALAGETVQAPDTLFALASTGMSGWVASTYSPRVDSEGNICGVIATVLDVTERRRTEDSLHENREKLRTIFASSPDAIVATDLDGIITESNERAASLHGFSSADEMIGVNGWSLFHPDSVGRAREQLKHAFETGLVSSDKILMLRRDGSEFPAEISVSVARDSSGQPSSLIAVTRDITERKEAEDALRLSQERLSLVMDVSGGGVWRWNLKNDDLSIDDRLHEMLGYDPGELPSDIQTWQQYNHPDEFETMMASCESHLKGKTDSYESEHRLLGKNGEWRWVFTRGRVVSWDSDGTPEWFIGVAIDITERKQAEEALKDSESRLRESQRMAHLGNWYWDVSTGEVEWSEEVYKIFRLDPQDFTPQIDSIMALSPWPEDNERDKELIQRAIENREQGSYEQRFLRPDGSTGYYHSVFRGIYDDDDGNLRAMEGTVQDITEARRAEEALRESEKRFKQLSDATWEAIAIHDNGVILEANDQYFDMFGFSPEELIGHEGIEQTTTPESAQRIRQQIAEGNLGPYLAVGKKKDGTEFPMELRVRVMDYHGREVRVAAIRDISERVVAEQRLRESEEKHRGLIQNLPQKIFHKDVNSVYISCNENYASDLGISADEIAGKTDFDFYPRELADKYRADDQRLMASGKPEEIEESYLSDGEELFVQTAKTPLADDAGNVVGILGIFWDITDRKRAEEALRINEERLDLAMSVANDGLYDWDLTTNTTYFDRRYYTMAGYEPDEYPRTFDEWAKRVHPDDLEPAQAAITGFLAGDLPKYDAEFRFRHKNGDWIWIRGRGDIVSRDDDGTPLRMVGTHTDITERKLAEEALRESEERFRSIIENTDAGYFNMDRDGIFRHVNAAWLKMYKYSSADEVIGKHFTEAQQTEDVELANVFVAGILAGDARYSAGEFSRKCKDGSTGYHTFSARPVSRLGEVVGIEGFLIDSTERMQAAEALQESEQFSRAVIENSPLGISVRSRDGLLLSVNEAWKDIWQIDEETVREYLVAEPDELILDEKDAYLGEWQEEVTKVYREGGMVHIPEMRLDNHRSRHERWVSQTFYAIKDNNDEVDRVVVLTNDITDRKRAEEAVRESEEKFRTYIASAPDAIFVADAKGRYVEVNDAACKLTGYSLSELVGMTIPELIDPQQIQKDKESFSELKASGRVSSETRLRRKDGSTVVASLEGVALSDDRFMAFCSDIGEAKAAEEALRQSEETYRALVKGLPDTVMRYDRDGRHLFASENVEKITKIPAGEFIGKTPREIGLPEDLCKTLEGAIRKVFDTGSPYETEFTFDASDGPSIIDWRLVAEFDAHGSTKSVLSIARDITQHRRLEHEYQALFQQMLDGFALHEIICDDQGKPIDYRFLAVNPSFERMTGLKATDVVGKTVMELMPGTEKKWIDVYGGVVQTGEPAMFEDFAKALDKHFEVTAFRPAPNQFACIFADVTETKRLKALESRAERLETAGTIAGQVAHDFNNLLSPIMAYPEFIHEELAHDNQAHAYLDAIESAAQKIADINQDLLTMGRRGHYNLTVLDLNRVVLQAAQEMELKSKTVTCDLDLCEGLMKIKGGDAQISRMLTNLLVNARDAMDDIGQLTIKTENFYADDASVEFGRVPKGEYVKLTVTDNGCGIPDDIVQKVLDPFFSTKTTDKRRGSGLGLSVVDAVMRDHGGYLDLSSKVGYGTSFYLYFPVTREDVTDENIARMEGGVEKVLVVDDDVVQREVSSQLLTRLGYQVTTVESGEKAVEFLRHNPQDLVVLDMVMPGGMDGTETYRQFLEFSPHQRAIILSGFSESERVIEVQKLGAGTFVRKPVTRQTIAAAIRTELNRGIGTPVTR